MKFLSRPKKKTGKIARSVTPTGVERHMGEDDIIVSKTDRTGRLLYCNSFFMEISGFTEEELLGSPHSIIRHPDMPRAVFKLLWETISQGKDLFAYVVNLSKNGDHYWVFAHVSPSYDESNNIIGYHSMRRKAYPSALERIRPVYEELVRIEQGEANRKLGLEKSYARLLEIIAEQEKDYDEFILSI